jgi:hypothetical protein
LTLDRVPSSRNVIDVLDHILDKGIVIDAWERISVAGIDLITVEARLVVASIETYMNYADAISQLGPLALGQSRRPAERLPSKGKKREQPFS